MHAVSDGTSKQLKLCLVICVMFIFLLIGGRALMADADDGTNGVLRSRAFKFYHITSQQAQELLSQLKIGTGYDQLSDSVLIVTSSKGSDLIQATEVITVLDQPRPVGIWVLLVGSDVQPLPNIDVLGATLRTVTVGTMKDAPPKSSKNPVILDTLDNKLIAIAAEELLPEIQKAVEAWKTQNPPALTDIPMPDTVTPAAEEQPVADEQPAAEKTPDPNKPAPAGEEPAPELVPLVPVQEEPSLEEVMNRLTARDQTAVVPTPADEAQADRTELVALEPDSTEDFMSDELLKALTEEEQALQPKPEPAPAVTAAQPAVQPQAQPETPKAATSEAGEEISLEEAIKKLLQEDKPTPPEQLATPEKLAPAPQPEPQRPEAISENLRLQREMAVLRQQLAEAKAQETAPEGTIELDEPQEAEDAPAPRIITQKPRNLTQFEEAVGEEQLETVVDLPQEVELEQLVDLVGKQLGLNYMYDPAILKNQKVFLKIHEGRIKVRDLYGLLESVLRLRGFVMIRRDNFVTILKSADAGQVAGQVDTVIRLPGDPIQPGDIIVSTLFRLEHIGTTTAQKTLTDMKLGMTNGFQPIPETNTLIVTDYASRMPRIEEVMQMVDVPGEEKIFKFRSLKYMQAGDLVTKLKDLVSNMEGVSMEVGDGQPSATTPTRYTTQRVRDPQTGRIETKQVPLPNQPQQVGAAAAPADDKTVFIDTDDRTNRVLVIGTQAQIELINQLIDTLDVPQADLNLVKEYVIQFVEASEVVNVLNELGLASVSVSTSSQTDTGRMTAAQRAAAARTPNQPTPAVATPAASAQRGSTGGDQPSISIRPATNSLLVNGTQEQHDAIELVIAHVDVVQKDQRTIREYEIQHVDTQEIIDTMSDLGIISSQSTQRGSAAQTGRTTGTSRTSARTAQQQQQPQLQAGEGGAPTALAGFAGGEGSSEDITAQEPQIAVLEATNSLLVFATPRQHKAISLLIAHADRVPETTTTPYVVYALENQDPLELAEVLTKLIQETVEEVGKTTTPESRIQTAGPTGSTTGAGGNGSVPSLEEQKIRIIPDEMSYSLIVYGNKRNQQWISELIKELDEYRPQVLLDCTLVEITKNDSFVYDLDILGKTYSSASLQTGNVGAALAPFTSDRFAEGRSTSGDAVAFFNSENVQALLEVVQSKGYGRIMARPKVLVNDNQEGEIKTENTTSVAQVKSIVQLPSDGGTPFTTNDVTFNEYKEGVTLTIKPHISKGDMLRLEITLNRTDFEEKPAVSIVTEEGPQSYPSPPDLLSTDVVTVATVPDGTTIILGGLEDLTQRKSNTKVPILGDLPLIGGLFRGVDNADDQSRLYVFVKANIIRPGDEIGGLKDIRRVSGSNRKTFEDLEAQFQEMQDFPGLDPAQMDPLKVLEIDDEIIGTQESN
jgi:type II secretory pathway component GspD/PulD (secretin)